MPRGRCVIGQAAQNALGRSAAREAADLLKRALEQLQTLPETPERAEQELALQASLGVAPDKPGLHGARGETCL